VYFSGTNDNVLLALCEKGRLLVLHHTVASSLSSLSVCIVAGCQRVDDDSNGLDTATAAPLKRRRWSHDELEVFWNAFGSNITQKKMPSRMQIAKLSHELPCRTVPQIRAQINNYILGKIKY